MEAVTVNTEAVVPVVGVPLISPVELLSDSPEGNAGETEYVLTVPVTVGDNAVMAVPAVKMFGVG